MSATSYTNPPTRTCEQRGLEERLAAAENEVATLKRALETARGIAAAVGIIMAIEKLTYDAAFAVLAQASQHQNRKLHDIAEEVVQYGAILGARPAETRRAG